MLLFYKLCHNTSNVCWVTFQSEPAYPNILTNLLYILLQPLKRYLVLRSQRLYRKTQTIVQNTCRGSQHTSSLQLPFFVTTFFHIPHHLWCDRALWRNSPVLIIHSCRSNRGGDYSLFTDLVLLGASFWNSFNILWKKGVTNPKSHLEDPTSQITWFTLSWSCTLG